MCLGLLFVIYCVVLYVLCFVSLLCLCVFVECVSAVCLCVFFLCDVPWFVVGLFFVVVERVLVLVNMCVCFV